MAVGSWGDAPARHPPPSRSQWKGLRTPRAWRAAEAGYCALLQSGGAKSAGATTITTQRPMELGRSRWHQPVGPGVVVWCQLQQELNGAVSLVGDGHWRPRRCTAVARSAGVPPSANWETAPLLRSGGDGAGDSNSFDELGHGLGSTAQASSDVPVTVKGLAGAVSLVGGDDNGSTGSGYTYCAMFKEPNGRLLGRTAMGTGDRRGAKSPRMFP